MSSFLKLILALISFQSLCLHGQDLEESSFPKTDLNPKKSFIYLGYNRSFYSPSTIKFRGRDHRFVLNSVKASDRPSYLSDVYVTDVSVPQYNIRWGRELSPFWNFTIGIDHMKYVVDQWQTVTIDGHIGKAASEKYAGDYYGESIVLSDDFLMFEHTDGLNYISAELETKHELDFVNVKEVSLIGGVGFGPVIPRSDVRLFQQGRNHMWNLSGWAFSMHVGMQLDFWQRYFLRYTGKYGRIELKAIPTTGHSADHAEQLIQFMENFLAVGVYL